MTEGLGTHADGVDVVARQQLFDVSLKRHTVMRRVTLTASLSHSAVSSTPGVWTAGSQNCSACTKQKLSWATRNGLPDNGSSDMAVG